VVSLINVCVKERHPSDLKGCTTQPARDGLLHCLGHPIRKQSIHKLSCILLVK